MSGTGGGDGALPRAPRAGDTLPDLCRVCKDERTHHVVAVLEGRIEKVECATCGSRHEYRGGGGGDRARGDRTARPRGLEGGGRNAFPIVSARERSGEAMSVETAGGGAADLETLLRRVIREEAGVTPVAPAEKWRGGDLVLRPGKPGVQDKVVPIETFFHKVVMVRNRLRVLEQQVNASGLPDDEKVRLQAYITAAYGSLTTFNVLFAEEEDRFQGSGE